MMKARYLRLICRNIWYLWSRSLRISAKFEAAPPANSGFVSISSKTTNAPWMWSSRQVLSPIESRAEIRGSG